MIMSFSKDNITQIEKKGIPYSRIKKQLDRFEKGFPALEIDRPATKGDGITTIPKDKKEVLRSIFQEARMEGRVMKFVPASGAATRMFKSLQAILQSPEKCSKSYIEQHPDDEEASFTRNFIENLASFPFFEDLKDRLRKDGLDPSRLIDQGEYRLLLSYVIEEKGLGLADMPKALIPFHRYDNEAQTPLEEHLKEAIHYCQSHRGDVRVHFTISPEHKNAFDALLTELRPKYETGNIRLKVETSFQKPETDTIAVDEENQPFKNEDGSLVFRPGGHGALLINLEESLGDLVFIKNIDNVVPDRLKGLTYEYKELIGGYLIDIEQKIFSYLKALEKNKKDGELHREITDFLKHEWCMKLPRRIDDKTPGDSVDQEVVGSWLFDRLNRPLRICGMVRNEGEPGGGPFIVRHSDGSTSLQIVESAQINKKESRQKKIFESATHFNPVDLVCSLRDYKGRPFRLDSYRDEDTGFISEKSHQGRKLKALELPGLWNGSMAYWNTLFIEVPGGTFNPVKTVNDLLREEHQAV